MSCPGCTPDKAVKFKQKLILVITNESSVFLKTGANSAYDIFGGRATEVKNLFDRIRDEEVDGKPMCSISMGFITGQFGFVPSNYVIMPYKNVMESRKDYEHYQDEKDYLSQLAYVAPMFDRIIICVPKDMLSLIMEYDVLPKDKVIAVTSLENREKCTERGWLFLERKGARVGNDNADRIFKEITSFCKGS